MTVLREYNSGTGTWVPIVSGVQGPTGPTGPTGATGPTGPNPGLQLISTTTVSSGVTSVTVSNVFSSTYSNYKIITSGFTSNTAGHSIKMQLNNSTGSSYRIGGTYGNFGSSTLIGYGPVASDSWTDVLPLDVTECSGTIELYSPFLSRRTLMSSYGVRSGFFGTWYQFHGEDTSTASNTGFTFFPIAGGSTFTGGTIRVYGYNN